MMHRMLCPFRAHTWVLVLSVVLAAGCLASCAEGAEVAVVLDPPRVEVAEGEDGSAVFICGAAQRLNEAGEPNVPWQAVTVLLPPGAVIETVQVSLDAARYEAVAGKWQVSPMPAPVANVEGREVAAWPRGRRIEAGRDVEIYSADAEWPATNIRLVSAGELRGWKLTDVAVPLIKYNPVTGSVQRLKAGTLRVTFDDELADEAAAAGNVRANGAGAGGNVRARGARASFDPVSASAVRRIAVNFEQQRAAYEAEAVVPTTEGDGEATVNALPGYAIITTSAIVSASTKLDDFVAHKQAYGYDVHVITEAQFGGGTGDAAANNIRAWLKANYAGLSLQYVLLVGDPRPSTGAVPMKMTWPRHNDPDYQEAPSDYFYADLTGNWDKDGDGYYGEWSDDFGTGGVDRHAEVLVGRIPYYGSIGDLDAILQKLIDYELEWPDDAVWRHDVLLPMEPSDASTPGYHLGEQIKTDAVVPEGWSYHRIYEENYGLTPPPETTPCNVTNVTNVWSAGTFGLIVWWTHGWDQGASDIMDTGHVPSLNDNYPGLTFQCSCDNSHPETTNNLSYALLKNGAICTVGATRVSWYYPGQTDFRDSNSNSGMAYGYAYRLVRDDMSSGGALHDLKEDLVPYGSAIWMNYVVFNIYGDPATYIDPQVVMFYVNAATGNDSWDGRAPAWDGTHGPKLTIQAGINAASDGHIVIVAAGTYSGTGNIGLDFGGRAITVRSASGPEATIIDCAGAGRGFYFHSSETDSAVVRGFTIANGTASSGGGVYCSSSSPRLVNCIITGCSADNGAGAYCTTSSNAKFINSIFVGNTTSGTGGAVYFYNSTPTMTNCTVINNAATGTYAAGIYCRSSSPTLTNCIVWGNTPQEFYLRTGAAPVLYSCDVQGGWSGSGSGNIIAEPMLASDRHLLGYSPCKDAGTSSGAPAEDMDGEARPYGTAVDIGADEIVDVDADKLGDWSETNTFGTDPSERDTDHDGMHDGYEVRYGFAPLDAADGVLNADGDVLMNWEEAVLESNPTNAATPSLLYVDDDNAGDPAQDGSQAHPFGSIQAAIDAVAAPPTVIVVRPGTYVEQLVLTSGVGIVGSGSNETVVALAASGLGPTVYLLGVDGGLLADMTITGGTGSSDVCVRTHNSTTGVRGCVVAAGRNGIGMDLTGYTRIVDCLIMGHTNSGLWMGSTNAADVVNCTIVDCAVAGGSFAYRNKVRLENTIFWGNADDLIINSRAVVTAFCCDVEDGDFAGTNGCFSTDPLFVSGPLHDYYLSQTAAGQAFDSPCVNTGSGAASLFALDGRTTRTDGACDEVAVDLGCHAATAAAITSIACSGDDITIEWTARAGASYRVEWSADRQTWSGVSVGQTGSWTDVGCVPGTERRFYRVREE